METLGKVFMDLVLVIMIFAYVCRYIHLGAATLFTLLWNAWLPDFYWQAIPKRENYTK
jgi:hypothetical protein